MNPAQSQSQRALPGRLELTPTLVATIVLLSCIAPLATDMYVTAFPKVADDLSASATQVQLTLTTFFIGMGLGQLLGGPVSDQRGRKHLILAGIVLMTLASVACALAPTIELLTAARLVQGLSGGWAMVIARAVIVDLAKGARLVRVLNVIAAVGGLAPIVGPIIGAGILAVSDWRMSFWMVAVLGVIMTVSVLVVVPESLPPEQRQRGGTRSLVRATREVLHRRTYVGYLMVSVWAMGAVFAYVSTSAFVLQSMNGLSPLAFSIDFGANAAGMTIASLVAARLVGRVATRSVILVGEVAALGAGGLLLVGALAFGTPLLLVVVGFFVLSTATGLIIPNGGALASAEVPGHPGTGSAILGCFTWIVAGTIAPLAGLGGETSAVPMALLTIGCMALSTLGLAIARPTPHGTIRPEPGSGPGLSQPNERISNGGAQAGNLPGEMPSITLIPE